MLALAVAAAAVLVGAYLALGGASYAPAKVADPCTPRDWTKPDGLEEVGNQIVLSALDGAACKLGVTREELVIAFESERSLTRFARKQGLEQVDVEELIRTGLERAITDAERAGALNANLAGLIRGIVERVPPGLLIDLLDRAPSLLFPAE